MVDNRRQKECHPDQRSVLKLSTFNNKYKSLKTHALILPYIRIREISTKNHRLFILPHNLEEYTAQLMRVRGPRRSFKTPRDLVCCKQHYKRECSNTKKILLFKISKKGLRCTLEEVMALTTPCLTLWTSKTARPLPVSTMQLEKSLTIQ
jgi:hypothetical protein